MEKLIAVNTLKPGDVFIIGQGIAYKVENVEKWDHSHRLAYLQYLHYPIFLPECDDNGSPNTCLVVCPMAP